MTRDQISVLVLHPEPARFAEFRRLWHKGSFPILPQDRVSIDFAFVKRPEDLQGSIAERRPDILVVHGTVLGDQPAYAAMWVLTQGVAGVLITDDSDPSRLFQTKRCRVLPVLAAAEETAAVLGREVERVRQERLVVAPRTKASTTQ